LNALLLSSAQLRFTWPLSFDVGCQATDEGTLLGLDSAKPSRRFTVHQGAAAGELSQSLVAKSAGQTRARCPTIPCGFLLIDLALGTSYRDRSVEISLDASSHPHPLSRFWDGRRRCVEC
jgi:hypothetical protein